MYLEKYSRTAQISSWIVYLSFYIASHPAPQTGLKATYLKLTFDLKGPYDLVPSFRPRQLQGVCQLPSISFLYVGSSDGCRI